MNKVCDSATHTCQPPVVTPPPPDKVCPASCSADSACQNQCPAFPGGVQCCDLPSGSCYVAKSATCPTPGG